jgi:hypothetical protein
MDATESEQAIPLAARVTTGWSDLEQSDSD